ncbi:hypothetical protein [Sinorhizobium meliloti]|uniref:hypothetical protein n=1 Tax=Rhizobium meliloti TaxID=382 RepID=UPI0018F4DDCB|nr:hypothetical protein [Sinorhizobium meliloti]
MTKFHIALTEEETTLLGEIDLRAKYPDHGSGREAYLSNRRPILALLGLLSERRAIPEVRLKWWNDPGYNSGRIISSRKGLFERDECSGAEIYVHPHFIPHLRYLLFGADLPETIMDAFEHRVGNPAWISSSDVIPLGKHARDLAAKRISIRAGQPRSSSSYAWISDWVSQSQKVSSAASSSFGDEKTPGVP